MTRRERGSSSDHAADAGLPRPASGTPAPHPADSSATVSFEEGLDQLARIVDRLEAGDLGLAAAIGAYEEGIALVRQLHGHLTECEQRVEMLAAGAPPGENGQRQESSPSGPGTDAPTAEGQRGSSRPAAPPRPGRPRRLPGMDDPGHGV